MSLLLLFRNPAVFEVIESRDTNNGNSGTANVTFPSTPVEGDLLVIVVLARAQSSTLPTTPSGWTFVDGETSTAACAMYCRTAGASEPTSVDITLFASGAWATAATAFRGTDASKLDKFNAFTQSSTAMLTGATGVLAQASELVVTGWGDFGNVISAFDNGQTEAVNIDTVTTGAAIAYKVVSATTSVDYGATTGSSGTNFGIVGTFRVGAAAATDTGFLLLF
jgi:hypothetical protein